MSTDRDVGLPTIGPCIFVGCVSRDRHWHFGFPGGYDNPDDLEGPPIPFTSEPAPGVRDYDGALLNPDPLYVTGDEPDTHGIAGPPVLGLVFLALLGVLLVAGVVLVVTR